jgi:hypothetical protein
MALHVVAGDGNVRPVRAHRRIPPLASVLRGPAGLAEIQALLVFGLCPARAITADRRPACAVDSLVAFVALTRLVTQPHTGPHCPDPANRGTVQHILALSRSAVTIRHWFEINLDDASTEHGARVEIREVPRQPHRGSESASQLTIVDRPLWRADLFDRLADPPGSFSAAHYHPQFTGNEPSARFWDAALTADPWTWLGEQITSLGTAVGGAAWPLDPEDAAELPGLASAVVATAQQFGPARCRSAAECFQLTRDVQDSVQLMIATLRAPERLDRDWVAPWLPDGASA